MRVLSELERKARRWVLKPEKKEGDALKDAQAHARKKTHPSYYFAPFLQQTLPPPPVPGYYSFRACSKSQWAEMERGKRDAADEKDCSGMHAKSISMYHNI